MNQSVQPCNVIQNKWTGRCTIIFKLSKLCIRALKVTDIILIVAAEQRKRLSDYDDFSSNRFSLLGMDVPDQEQSTHAPMIAAPAALGYGPTVAMPTLMGMMPEMKDFEEEETDVEEGLDLSNASVGVPLRVKSPGVSSQLHK